MHPAVAALYLGDEEELILQEINKDAGIFEGSIPIQAGGGYGGDGFLGTINSGSPEYLPEEVARLLRTRFAQVDIMDSRMPPGTEAAAGGTYLLGTDEQGRDMLSRLLHGGRMTLLAGLTQ